ncbi:MAG: magnesium transporter [Chloroflexi bacterium]|nr:MAG: magnesium transporter [Chloroflexota bacterium]RLT52626.1 MAG: magnesium transporter [Chloroflexota bacterium]
MNTIQLETVLRDVRDALEQDDVQRARQLLEQLQLADRAETIGDLNLEEQTRVLPSLPAEDAADVLEYLDEDEAAQLAATLPAKVLAQLLDEMYPDDAADILLDLKPAQRAQTLALMQTTAQVQPLLAYEDETAGGRMTSDVPVLRRWMTAAQAISYLRGLHPESESQHYLYAVDRDRRLLGVVGLRDLIVAMPETTIEEIMNPHIISAPVDAEQAELAQLISRHGLSSLPVVDAAGRLVGVITHDDLLEVIEDEATSDLYALASMSADSDLDVDSPLRVMVKRRLPWLLINLGTAIFAAWVISIFEGTLQKLALLAVFQSVVAGMGGNAGTQALVIFVRGLALGQVQPRSAIRAVAREVAVGMINGVAVGVAAGIITYLWKGQPYLGVLIGIALFGNMLIAGVAGALVPLTLRALRMDPALASAVFVTTVTDAVGFALFLGLATAFLPLLL